MICCDWLRLIFPPKILVIVLEFLLGKDKRVQELFDAEKQPANCVHTSITRESVMISSTQVLFAEKFPGMNSGTVIEAERILLFVNTTPTPKSCNYMRKSNRGRIFKSNIPLVITDRAWCNLAH